MTRGEWLDRPVMHIGWRRHVHNALTLLGVVTWRDLLALSDRDLLTVKNFGRTSLEYVKARIAEADVCVDERLAAVEPSPVAVLRDRLREASYTPLKAPPVSGVYFIRVDMFVKIGMAADIRHRLTGLETATPFDMELLAYIQTDGFAASRRIERELHVRFGEFRHRREWFRLEPPIEEYIRGLIAVIARSAA